MKNTPESSYSYVSVNASVNKVEEDALSKAVRVTTTVSKKIGNTFAKNFTIAGVEQKQVDAVNASLNEVKQAVAVETTTEDSGTETGGGRTYLISKTVDETADNLMALAKKLEALQTQKKVLAVVKRMALYTRELVELAKNATKKWFAFLVPATKVAETPVASVVTKSLEEDFVPFNWNSVVQEKPTQAIEASVVAPVVEEKKEAIVTPTVEAVVAKPVEIEKPVVEFNYDFGMPTLNQTVEEPTSVTNISNVQDFAVPGFAPEASEAKVMENAFTSTFEQKVEDTAPSSNAIMARMHMIGNGIGNLYTDIAKKEELLKASNIKNDSLAKEIEAYKTVNRDLSDRISTLINQIDALAKDKSVKTKLLEDIKNNHEKTVTAMTAEYEEKLRRAEVDREALVIAHEQEVEALKRDAKMREERVKTEFIASMKSVYDGMQNIAEAVKTPSKVKSPETSMEDESYELAMGYAKAA